MKTKFTKADVYVTCKIKVADDGVGRIVKKKLLNEVIEKQKVISVIKGMIKEMKTWKIDKQSAIDLLSNSIKEIDHVERGEEK